MQIMEPKPVEQMPKMSEEDAAKWKEATKHYNKLKLYEHRMWQMDISAKIQLREAALAALPGALPPPVCTPLPFWVLADGVCASRAHTSQLIGSAHC